MHKDILICGVGGQGTVLASRIIAAAAMDEGSPVHSAETIGMAQRGGSVTSHVRIGEGACSPLIPFGGADMLLAFEPAEAVRNLKYLREGGLTVVNTAPVPPVTESLRPTGYDGKEMTAWLKDQCACIFVNGDEVCRPSAPRSFSTSSCWALPPAPAIWACPGRACCGRLRRMCPPGSLSPTWPPFRRV